MLENKENTIQVLDHGFVTLRNMAGPTRRISNGVMDEVIIDGAEVIQILKEDLREFDADSTDPANSARMSFNQTDSGRTREQDLGLCAYLFKNIHNTPIEMIEVWLEMKMPIFIARQFVRHRTATINEVSGRYVQLPAEWYIPEVVGGKPVGGAKQGQSDTLDKDSQEDFKEVLNNHCQSGYKNYEQALEYGVAAEHARMFLSLNHYTHWIWKQDLHNLFHCLALRADSHAQIEAQKYALAIIELLTPHIPELMELFNKYRRIKRD